MKTSSEFDTYAPDYDQLMAQMLAATGEGRRYFARERCRWLARYRSRRYDAPRLILDYGCGIGDSTPLLTDLAPEAHIVGVDISIVSIRRAVAANANRRIEFRHLSDFTMRESADLAYTNGTFSFIPEQDRPGAIEIVFRALKPGGTFAFFENNPWNPGTRWLIQRSPLDRTARLISPRQAITLLRGAGFCVEALRSLFFFPRSLRSLRVLDPLLSLTPLGGQYVVIARKD